MQASFLLATLYEVSFLPQVTPPATHFFPELQPRPQVTPAGTYGHLDLNVIILSPGNVDKETKMNSVR